MQKVAYWTNGFGEEISSRVFSEFSRGDERLIVVRAYCFFVLDRDNDNVTVRMEQQR